MILLDSVVNLKLLEFDEVQRLFADAPPRVRRAVARMDRSESGTETLARLRLRAKGVPLRPQVVIDGIGRVDFLIGESLVLEIDSVAHHTHLDAYRKDRERDLKLQALGYHVIRLTYEQVLNGWPEAEQHILAMVALGAHQQTVHAA